MQTIVFTEIGTASRIKDNIFINAKLLNSQYLFSKLLQHELEHNKEETFLQELMTDLRNLINVFDTKFIIPYTKFYIQNPREAIQQLNPFSGGVASPMLLIFYGVSLVLLAFLIQNY